MGSIFFVVYTASCQRTARDANFTSI
ncbi:hypothetical protein NC653_006130 [Populus alba x Populus x berolinensis]|uniref:Uncharacterized protein n=1 Tax=Populus alba x Populus x berolinensis TaxID=444605 RepID=A0AAD6REZ3_9ROSI|nr:hypothetical protein NC653_006130 [Populus alba x Populus x berolinensis]